MLVLAYRLLASQLHTEAAGDEPSAYVTSAYVSIRQHTSAYVSRVLASQLETEAAGDEPPLPLRCNHTRPPHALYALHELCEHNLMPQHPAPVGGSVKALLRLY